MTEFIAIIPAGRGSKGLPGKNMVPLAGQPLWRWSLDQARAAGAKRIIVTTDIPGILEAPSEPDVTVLERPAELAGDTTPMAPVLLHALADEGLQGATSVLLQPTSPLRTSGDIRAVLTTLKEGEHDLAMTVTQTDQGVLKYGTLQGTTFAPLRDPAHCFANRQSLPPVFRPTGAVYAFDRDWFLQNKGFETDRIGAVVLPVERSIDIDNQADLDRAAAWLSR